MDAQGRTEELPRGDRLTRRYRGGGVAGRIAGRWTLMPREPHLAWTALDSSPVPRTISGLPERGLTLKPVMIECQGDERDLIRVFLAVACPSRSGGSSRPAAPA
jgi:hypothetical protein